jgi:thiamine kinase-like enzyme
MDSFMNSINEILQSAFSLEDWVILRPERGLRKECYIAKNKMLNVFVKFDVPVENLKRLGEIAVSPKLLSSGVLNGTPYIIQEYVNGQHPDRLWLRANIPLVAQVVNRYHKDPQLGMQLKKSLSVDYAACLNADLENLEHRFLKLSKEKTLDKEVTRGFNRLVKSVATFQNTTVVPVHGEPNFNNMLLSPDKLFFIDWDEITLSDPIRDIGPLIWWYFPETCWATFFNHYGEQLTNDIIGKVYWFAARTSLDVAMWHVENKKTDRGFFKDFVTAIRKRANPQI